MRRSSQRKDRQLCAQVRRALELAFAESTDGRLAGAWVRDVVPAPDVGHLLVTVEVPVATDIDATYEFLRASTGFLRSEVAGAIARRRTPELRFQVVPMSAPPEVPPEPPTPSDGDADLDLDAH